MFAGRDVLCSVAVSVKSNFMVDRWEVWGCGLEIGSLHPLGSFSHDPSPKPRQLVRATPRAGRRSRRKGSDSGNIRQYNLFSEPPSDLRESYTHPSLNMDTGIYSSGKSGILLTSDFTGLIWYKLSYIFATQEVMFAQGQYL
jgi:hypothetical protein